MLKCYVFTFRFTKFIQSNMYIDFFFKKISEILIRNLLVYSSLFFGEKYMIEFLTKNIIESFILNNNRYIGWSKLQFSYYFVQILSLLFYFISIINLIYII